MDISKLAFATATRVIFLGAAFLFGLNSGLTRNSVYRFIDHEVLGAVRAVLETSLFSPSEFLAADSGGEAGVVVNRQGDDGALILLSGFFGQDNTLRLIRRDGSVVAEWPVRFSELFPDPRHMQHPPATDWNIDTHGALALPDGSVVFNFDYGGLVKLDRCGGVAWTLDHPTHHSVELAESGGFWVPGRRYVTEGQSELPPFEPPYEDDLILHVSDDGKIVSERSLARLMFDSGLEPLLTATGRGFSRFEDRIGELIHLNKIAELRPDVAAAFPQFAPGDLLLSDRVRNLVMVVDGQENRVKWWQVGPWRRQHDPEFTPDGTIVVFNNNTYVVDGGASLTADGQPRSNVMEVDPRTGTTEVIYGQLPEQAFLSTVRGKQELLPGGGMLITDFELGRIVETSADGETVWKYVNRYDAEQVAEVTEARLYPAGYFTITDWSCPVRSD